MHSTRNSASPWRGSAAEHARRPAALLLALTLWAAAAVPAPCGENPHAFMGDPASCADCHAETPVPGRDDYTTVTFTDSIVALCSTCHEGEHFREEHPVEIRPEYAVPDDLHLDNYYTITCATCHDPHGTHETDTPYLPRTFWEQARDRLARKKVFPTRFLRRPHVDGGLCTACHEAGVVRAEGDVESGADAFPDYVGSEACRECHPVVWEQWSRTLHARNFSDAKKNPSAVKGEFRDGEPFPLEEVLWTVGEHWTQRYVVDGKRGLQVVPDTWSLQARSWGREGSFNRSWKKYCAGCHVTALNPFTDGFLETGTGCEACHGPGRLHVESTDQYEIVNPALLVESRRDMICEACHTAGHDRSGSFRYPIGFRPGQDLMRYYRGLVPKPGQDVTSYTGDGSYEDRHRQFHFWISRVNVLQGVTCDVCSAHRRPAQGMEDASPEYRLTPEEMCGTCHFEIKKDMADHSGHDPRVAGCLDCHPPALESSRTHYSIHDHKFQFTPPTPEHIAGGDPCQGCHDRRGVTVAESSMQVKNP